MRAAHCLAVVLLAAAPVAAELSNAWVVPAVAHTPGAGQTFWYSDVSLHNPHAYDLPVTVLMLPSDTANWTVDSLRVTLYPYETFNLWDVAGSDWFAHYGTGALLVYVDPDEFDCTPIEACDFLVSSRTYTVAPWDGAAEFGQAVPGQSAWAGVDWWSFGYAGGILNGGGFRCNAGMASWTGAWTTVQVDVQDAAGSIVDTEVFDVPPFGHVQRRLAASVTGGSLVFYLVDGPDDAFVVPYASVVDERTGDPSYFAAVPSIVGVSVEKASARPGTSDRILRDRPAARPLELSRAQLDERRARAR